MAVGIQKGGGVLYFKGSRSMLINTLGLLFNSDFVLWLKMVIEEFMTQE